jgi:hypothetical protein
MGITMTMGMETQFEVNYSYLFHFFYSIGDYGISRSMGITMTMGVGTQFEVNYFYLFHFF